MNDNLVENVRYGYGRGWSFTPLHGKRAYLLDWSTLPRETLEEALAWAAKGNVGMRTGQNSRIVIIDGDPGSDLAPLNLPKTVMALTGRPGGKHLYFRTDQIVGNPVGMLGPHIDVRGDGGQVVFPGSVHPETGVVYAWAEGHEPWDMEIAELPPHILEILRKPEPKPAEALPPPKVKAGGTREERYAAQALRLELNKVNNSKAGNRNDTLNKAAFSMGTLIGGGYLDRQQVEEALTQAASAVGLEDGEIEGTICSGVESGIKEPRRIDLRQNLRVRPDLAPNVSAPLPPLPAGRFALDLYGNADRFLHLFGQDVLWCDQHGKWYVWNGACWEPDAIRDVYRMAERTILAMVQECKEDKFGSSWAAKCCRDGRAAREMLEAVKHRRPVLVEALDRNPWLLGVANGVIDLQTGDLLPHDRKHLITSLSPAWYDLEAPCPRWMQFVGEIMAGSAAMIQALQRLAGYFLTGDIAVQILPIFFGPGGNGKNVFLDTLMGIMGPYAEEAPDGFLTVRQGDEHPTEIADLHGKRLIVASETEEGRKMRIGLVKKITGNKYLKGRFMRQDYFQFERTHKTVLVTNNKPIITESSNAVWRRLRLIPFTVTIPEAKQDRQLTEKLVAEWPGILAWAVRGCLDWQKRKCDLEFPEAVKLATDEYRSDSDHVADFIAECCEDWRQHPQQNMRTPKEQVYSTYSSWCKGIGEDTLTRNAFNSRMRIHGFEDKPARVHGNDKTQKCWLNLTLRGDSDAI